MSTKNRESLLWQKVKKGLNKCFLTRIESSTINGIPDIHGVSNGKVFWIELKSDEHNYPKLNKWQIVWINRYIKAGGVVFILEETLRRGLLNCTDRCPVSLILVHLNLVSRSRPLVNGHWSSSASSGSWDLLPEQQEARSRFLASCYFYLFVVTRGLVTRSSGSRCSFLVLVWK